MAVSKVTAVGIVLIVSITLYEAVTIEKLSIAYFTGDFFGRSVNLHSLWDTGMIQRKMDIDFQSQRSLYFEYLINQMNFRYAQNISDWTQCSSEESRYLACSSIWIQEDAELSCNVVYRDENNQQITSATRFNISETYYNTRMDTVELRLIQGGVRLAAVINKIVEINYTEKEPDETQSATLPRLSFPLIALILMYILFY